MTKRSRQLTAAWLRVLRVRRGSYVLTCSANICRFWMALFRISKKASVRRRVAMAIMLFFFFVNVYIDVYIAIQLHNARINVSCRQGPQRYQLAGAAATRQPAESSRSPGRRKFTTSWSRGSIN